MPGYVERNLKAINFLTEQIEEADRELGATAKADPTCRGLMTVPGVGPVTAVRFAGAVDQVERFPNSHALESYVGLVPGENSSSERKRITGLTKAGAQKLRWTLIQAAWSARRCRRNDPLVAWALQVEARIPQNALPNPMRSCGNVSSLEHGGLGAPQSPVIQ